MRETTLTLRRTIILVVVLGILIPATFINGYSWFTRYHDGIRKQTEDLLQKNAEVLSNGMQEPLWHMNQESGHALLKALLAYNEDLVRIEVRDNANNVFVSGERLERRAGFTASAEKPVTYHGSTIGSIRIEVGSARLRDIMTRILLDSMFVVIFQVLLSIALILMVLDRRLARPLHRLEVEAEPLAERQLDTPFTAQRLDEIGMLSHRLEETCTSLRTLFKELDRKNWGPKQDISIHKRVEQELHQREERFRVLIEQSPIAIIEWNSKFEVIEWNNAAERIFGYSRLQALGKHASFILLTANRASTRAFFGTIANNGRESRNITENCRMDGKIITCQWCHTRLTGDTNRSNHWLSIAEDITEKRCIEEARTLSEAKFAGAFLCNPDAVTISRISDGVLIDVNQVFEEMTGYSHQEAVGKSAIQLDMWVAPHKRQELQNQLRTNKVAPNFVWEMRTKHGSIRQCTCNATTFTVGHECYMLAVIRDITEQRLLEEQKAEAERALLRLAQGTQDMMGESFFELLVADLASALRTDRAFIGLRVPGTENQMRTLAAYVQGQIVENFEYVITDTPCDCTMFGDICIFPSDLRLRFPRNPALAHLGYESYAGAPLRDAHGAPIGVLAVMHSDVLGNPDLVRSLLQVFSERASTEIERKRAAEELRSSEFRFSIIFQSSPIAMLVTQRSGGAVIQDVNSAFEKLFLRNRESVIGKNTLDLALYCDDADRALVNAELKQIGTITNHPEVWMNRGDQTRVLVQLAGHTFTQSGETFDILAYADVTDKRRIENEIRELNANLEQRVIERTEELQQANEELAYTLDTLNKAQEELVRSEKLAALGSLVAGIAHELNTPIGNSLMVASTLTDQTRALTENYHNGGLKRSMLENYINDASKAGDILVRNLHRAADLVTGFKQVAVDQTSSQRRSFSLAEAVAEIMLTLWPTLKKTSFVVKQSIPDSIKMDGYPGPLGQALTNLINNALLHGFDGRSSGTVSISAQALPNNWVELSIKDDGVGIPSNHINRIFDPFFTTKLGAGGSGLGLHITHNIVTGVLGGRIRVYSQVNQGATFTLTLPLEAPHMQNVEESLSNR